MVRCRTVKDEKKGYTDFEKERMVLINYFLVKTQFVLTLKASLIA